ncbi:MAG TPA: hypothetical protein VJI32_01095 [Candidatus Nanoarchaeia archaeon]|nr:hypothetical protein [Candidatus Nanoarchaeia archaeon]
MSGNFQKILASLAFSLNLLAAPAQARPASDAPVHYREFNLSFSDNYNPSLEPVMLVHNAHTLESMLNEALWRLEPHTFLGRAALLGAAFYEQAVFNAGVHELGHYQEAREAGRKIEEFPLWRVLILQGYVQHSGERGMYAVTEDLSILSRGLAINMALAHDVVRSAVSSGYMNPLDGLSYAANHAFVSTPIMDKKIYEDYILELHGAGSSALRNTRRDILGISIFNALDPYTIYSAWGVGKYLSTGNPTQSMPSPAVPQLNGYLAVPQPLYEACWYVPWQEGVLSAALRAGNAVENYAALRLGLHHLGWKNMQLSGFVEGIHSGSNDGIAVHGSVLFPIAGIKVGPTISYKSDGVWTPFMNGLSERVVVGIGIEL